MDTDQWRFLCACAGGSLPQKLFYSAEAISAVDAGVINSLFGLFFQDRWFSYQTTPQWTAVAMAAAHYPGDAAWIVIALGQSGQLWELRPAVPRESLSNIPDRIGMTNLATIRNEIHACGMGRVVLRRDGTGVWTDLSAPWPNESEGVIGFNDIDGLADGPLYAVGWQGEIWVRTTDLWIQQDSPTNAHLSAVVVAPDGTVYCAGDAGTLIRGRQGAWEQLETGVDNNLQDICVYEGQVFVCSDYHVFRLGPNGLDLDLSESDDEDALTCLKLVVAAPNRLYSIGAYDAFVREAGIWKRIAP